MSPAAPSGALHPIRFGPLSRPVSLLAECRRQSLALHDDTAERDTQRWLEQIADTDGWTG